MKSGFPSYSGPRVGKFGAHPRPVMPCAATSDNREVIMPTRRHRESDDDIGLMTPWQAVLFGLGCLGLGAVFFFLIHFLEVSGGSARVHWLVALSYYIGGKWTVAVLFGLGSLIFFVLAYVKYSKEDE